MTRYEIGYTMVGIGVGVVCSAIVYELRDWWRRKKNLGRWGRN